MGRHPKSLAAKPSAADARLRVLWRYLMNRDFRAQQILAQLEGSSAGAIIANLERLCHQDSEGL